MLRGTRKHREGRNDPIARRDILRKTPRDKAMRLLFFLVQFTRETKEMPSKAMLGRPEGNGNVDERGGVPS